MSEGFSQTTLRGWLPSLRGWLILPLIASPIAYLQGGWPVVRDTWIFALVWFGAVVLVAELLGRGEAEA